MPPVFAHGRLRLYLLKLLDEAPRHGYEVIRLLEERFQGLYAPSAGTVYPRLAKLEAEGLVTHATEGGRKVYSITDAGRAELAGAAVNWPIWSWRSASPSPNWPRRSATTCAARRASCAARCARRRPPGPPASATDVRGTSRATRVWRAAKEELRRAKQEWKEQARRAKDESRRAREEAQQARRQAKEAQEGPRGDAAHRPAGPGAGPGPLRAGRLADGRAGGPGGDTGRSSAAWRRDARGPLAGRDAHTPRPAPWSAPEWAQRTPPALGRPGPRPGPPARPLPRRHP